MKSAQATNFVKNILRNMTIACKEIRKRKDIARKFWKCQFDMIRIELFLRGLFYIKYNGLKSSLIVSTITIITCKEIRKRKKPGKYC